MCDAAQKLLLLSVISYLLSVKLYNCRLNDDSSLLRFVSDFRHLVIVSTSLTTKNETTGTSTK